jgi:hypothetical protein
MIKKFFLFSAVATLAFSCGKNENKTETVQEQPAVSVNSAGNSEMSQPMASVAEPQTQVNTSVSTETSAQPQAVNNSDDAAILTFAETSHDFGKINAGQKVKHVFKFKNTGKSPLMITKVQPACGCTAPEWTKDPVPPGGSGSVTLEFDSQGRSGIQTKTATVESNTKGGQSVILTFKTEVIALAEGPVKK